MLITSALTGAPISTPEKGAMKDNNAMTEHEKGMMKDDKDAMMKNKMKAEKKGQAGKTDDKMKMNEKKQQHRFWLV